ncbi:hypothetical protein LIER_42042 [Lithospermum erythrorhizon]|uniref:Endonuclease/exonuclease/phosphatase domain-containing protein n=1 Tax=Lithospermum erythrorhizon TaxID=34254 RepID=A0AAV3RM25_LITER
MGDFNDIFTREEKEGGNTRSEPSMSKFRAFIRDGGLLDLGYTGEAFTWCNRRDKDACIKARLDRYLGNPCWCLNFPGATVYHLEMIGADHRPLLLDTEAVTEKAKHGFVFDLKSAYDYDNFDRDGMLVLERELEDAWVEEEIH